MSDLIERLSQDLRPVTPPRPAAVTAGVLFAVAAGAVAVEVWMAGVRADAAVVATRLDTVVALAGAVLLGLSSALSLVRLGQPGARAPASLAAAQALGAGLMLASFALGSMPEGATAVAGLSLHGVQCSGSLAAFALLPGVATFAAARRMAPVRPAAAARAAAMAAAAVGFAGITMACGADHPVHGLVYHAAPLAVVGAVAGAALGRLLRW